MLNVDLLKRLSEANGVPGFEKEVRNLIEKEVSPYVDSVSTDNFGNLIATKKGRSDKKVMIAAHMDEIGFIVSHIDDKGFLRFHTLGGFDPKTLSSQRVIVHGKKDLVGVLGTKPIHLMSPEERTKGVEIKDFFIDLGLEKEEVEKYVEVGTPISRQRDFIEMGNCLNGKSMDNRISVFILIEALKSLKSIELPYNIYAVFTAQEEVGIRGAQVVAQHVQPDFGFAVDTTIAFDTPGAAAHESVTCLGKGVGIKIMDASAIADTRLVRFMKQCADSKKIDWQAELMPGGGTDTANIQRMTKNGAIVGAIAIPTRYIHTVIESVHRNDVGSAINLLCECLIKMDKFDYTY